MPVDAEALYARLIEQVHATIDACKEVPCLGPDAEDWTSDDELDQLRAADRCWDCPLVFQCRAYAIATDEPAGVWGGHMPEVIRRQSERARRRVLSDEAKERARARRRARRAERYLRADFQPDFLEDGTEKPRSNSRNGYPIMMKNTGTCKCECGEETGPKASYRPGHDARHVSALVGYLQNDISDGKKITAREIASLAKQLPSEALRGKFTRAAKRVQETAAAKAKGGEAA